MKIHAFGDPSKPRALKEYEIRRRELDEVFGDANRNGYDKDELDDAVSLTKSEFYIALIGLAQTGANANNRNCPDT